MMGPRVTLVKLIEKLMMIWFGVVKSWDEGLAEQANMPTSF
jgi:hypothetical protein